MRRVEQKHGRQRKIGYLDSVHVVDRFSQHHRHEIPGKLQVSVRLGHAYLVMYALHAQDITPVGHAKSGEELTFKHPAVQSAFMFLGETLCFLPYFFLRWRKQQRHKAQYGAAYVSSGASSSRQKRRLRIIAAFALPALCDAAATTLLNVGLYYT